MQPRNVNAVICNVVNEFEMNNALQCDNALDYNNPVQWIHFSVMMICSVMIQCNVVSALEYNNVVQCDNAVWCAPFALKVCSVHYHCDNAVCTCCLVYVINLSDPAGRVRC